MDTSPIPNVCLFDLLNVNITFTSVPILFLSIDSLLMGVIYLYWSMFGLESRNALNLVSQAWILQMAGYILYAMFYILIVIVLLNALIAIMSNVYNDVEV